MGNTIRCAKKQGKVKGTDNTWNALSIEATVDGVEYQGLVFSKTGITPDNQVKFENIK